ncbi:MAG: sulfite oxidase [Proteobacteria bacterium]|nr:sulfite oxidase [Pseudomonadota bacterium]
MTDKKRGIHALYAENPEQADLLTWGRKVDPTTRRGFFKKSGLVAMTAFLGANIPFADKMPGGLIPAALAASEDEFQIQGKEGLTILNDRPINAEAPPHLLDDEVTPAKYLFVRNNGLPPEEDAIDVSTWTLEIAGESCEKPTTFTIAELKEKFEQHTYQLQLECGGNGRSAYDPPARGNQWSLGAVGCPKWTGVRLKDVLNYCGVKEDAVYIGYYGADKHLSGDPNKQPISRGVPIAKAMEDEMLIAWSMNDDKIPLLNGYPLRLLCSGWPASTSGKWLKKLVIRNKIHDGTKMTGKAYRTPCESVAPGSKVEDDDMCIIESMPVKSLITYPKTGAKHKLTDGKFAIRGHAWAGDLAVQKLLVSIDFGATWKVATLKDPVNRFAWQHWNTEIKFPQKGYYEIWAKAMDDNGKSQPMVVPGWNPKGYLNNSCHRIAVQVV